MRRLHESLSGQGRLAKLRRVLNIVEEQADERAERLIIICHVIVITPRVLERPKDGSLGGRTR